MQLNCLDILRSTTNAELPRTSSSDGWLMYMIYICMYDTVDLMA